jgi:uncharacterized protein (UPF0262 family)
LRKRVLGESDSIDTKLTFDVKAADGEPVISIVVSMTPFRHLPLLARETIIPPSAARASAR